MSSLGEGCLSGWLSVRDQDLWALTLLIERRHGEDASRFSAEKSGVFLLSGETSAAEMWREVVR